MKSDKLIVAGLSMGEDFCFFKSTFALCVNDDYIIVDLMEFDDEMMYKIKNKYGIEEAPNEIREVLMRKLIELARLEKARSHKTTVSI
jgi:hypothetical protein